MTDKPQPTTEDLAREMRASIGNARAKLGMPDPHEEAKQGAQAVTETEQLIERVRGTK